MPEMWTYQGVYRCKLCGKIFYGEKVNAEASLDPEVDSFAWHFDCKERCWGAGENVGIHVVKYINEYWDD